MSNTRLKLAKIKQILSNNLRLNFCYLVGRKKVGKKWRIFLPVTNFFVDYLFYQRLFLPTNTLTEYFLQTRIFSIFLKVPLVYLFDFKFD